MTEQQVIKYLQKKKDVSKVAIATMKYFTPKFFQHFFSPKFPQINQYNLKNLMYLLNLPNVEIDKRIKYQIIKRMIIKQPEDLHLIQLTQDQQIEAIGDILWVYDDQDELDKRHEYVNYINMTEKVQQMWHKYIRGDQSWDDIVRENIFVPKIKRMNQRQTIQYLNETGNVNSISFWNPKMLNSKQVQKTIIQSPKCKSLNTIFYSKQFQPSLQFAQQVVNKDPHRLQYVKKYNQILNKIALKKWGKRLGYIKEPTDEEIRLAFQQDSYAGNFTAVQRTAQTEKRIRQIGEEVKQKKRMQQLRGIEQ